LEHHNGFFGLWDWLEEEFTLPVELSSFTAVLTAQKLCEVELDNPVRNSLERLLRVSGIELATEHCALVSHLIGATTVSSAHQYVLTDQELYYEGTYYYWLQSSDLDGSSQFFGPVPFSSYRNGDSSAGDTYHNCPKQNLSQSLQPPGAHQLYP
jgi:hypothetical protein